MTTVRLLRNILVDVHRIRRAKSIAIATRICAKRGGSTLLAQGKLLTRKDIDAKLHQ